MPEMLDIHFWFTPKSLVRGAMAIPKSLRAFRLCVFFTASFLPIGLGSVVRGQDAFESTPPELRDFRLDTPPAPTLPSSVPSVDATSPPATPPIVEPTPAPVIRQPSAGGKVAPRSRPTSAVDNKTDVSVTPLTDTPSFEAAKTDAANIGNEAPAKASLTDKSDATNTDVVKFAALAGLCVVIGSLALVMWRRRKRALAPAVQKAATPALMTTIPKPEPVRAPPITRLPISAPTSALSISFVPESAIVGFTGLTISGQLLIANTSEPIVDKVAVHAELISASNAQQSAIDSFFAQSTQRPVHMMDQLKPGENNVPLSLNVALNEMETFSVQSKTLLAPILIVKLCQISSHGTHQIVARLVCMIGRESNPPQQRMAPLRLDQGPRSFTHLGQRALTA